MQNAGQGTAADNPKVEKVSLHQGVGKSSSSPHLTSSSPIKSESDSYSQPRFISDTSESEDDDVSEVESFVIDQVGDLEEAEIPPSKKFLLSQEESEHSVDPETQARLEALLEAAGIGKISTGDGKQLADPEVLRRLTSSVSCALDEAAAALTRMRNENPRPQPERSLVEACTDGDVGTVRKLLTEGRSVHETTDEGESLLSLACSAGYFELAQVLLAMHANVEDRGIKGDCTPLMEAASSGYLDIVRLLIHNGADVNAQSSSGNTPLMYACAGGHEEVVRLLLDAGANVEDHNENGHTPLMEAASAGHVNVAAILLKRGAGINTHSNEFKESALTLACYKGHLDMVRFLLGAGADQEHKTDEMHTALMEASMDGHVEVARLLLDSGAQVNMPTDSFESPLTLAACGGHVDLALLLIERGANIEEVNDEGYTPLMEAAREGHEEMVSVLLSKGANINAQTEETQETALTLACCGGFMEVAHFLIKNGAQIELGASTPLMEAAQEGHMDLVRYLLEHNADVNAQTQTGDTALTYACENGHTEVAKLLLQYSADLEHESEGGRTPLMKACRAGHLCTVKYLLSQNADVNKQTTNNDHTPLSLACAGGHIAVVELLLAHNADPCHKLKDNSTMLIEAAKGGHTNVVQLLLDYPHSVLMSGSVASSSQLGSGAAIPHSGASLSANSSSSTPNIHQVPDAVRAASQEVQLSSKTPSTTSTTNTKHNLSSQKSFSRKSRPPALDSNNLTSPEAQQVRNQPGETREDTILDKGSTKSPSTVLDAQYLQRQQIVEELQRVEMELKEKASKDKKGRSEMDSFDSSPSSSVASLLTVNPQTAAHLQGEAGSQVVFCEGVVCSGTSSLYHASTQSLPPSDVTQATPVSDRPKAKPAWKKEGKVLRKQTGPFPAGFQPHSHTNQLKQLPHLSDQHLSMIQQHQQGSNEEMILGINSGHLMGPPLHIHHSVPDGQIRNLQELTEVEILQRRCPLMAQADEDAFMDLAKSGKLDQATIDSTLEGLTLDQVANAASADRERIRLNASAFMAGVEVASKALMGTSGQSPFQMVTNEHGAIQMVPTEQGGLPYIYSSGNNSTSCPGTSPVRTAQTGSLTAVPATTANPLQVSSSGFQPQLLLKAHPPWVKGVDGGGTTCREQVQTGTQTSPALVEASQPSPNPGLEAAVKESGDVQVPTTSITATTTTTTTTGSATVPPTLNLPSAKKQLAPVSLKGKKVRYQHQKALHSAAQVQEGNQRTDASSAHVPAPPFYRMDVDSATDSNNDTALTLACAGGHEELVELLLSRGANIEHRDKKGFTPLILAATAGHEKVVEILLNHSADMEAQSERTKDTPLSLACSGGRYEVVELLLSRGASKEHRNVSDYTPLSLAASGGYVNIIKLLLSHGAEINSRTGSKLGISPLMLAAMNGHTAAVKLLLDMGSDINAQIETNKNTALTLACFQGRHEVVSLLLDRKANVEHRAKTGLTPLMEAASGGYVDVGRVLLDKGADVNAPPVPSSRDTALTIAADKGHTRFVELLLNRSAQVEVKNKKGNSPLWLAANGGHLAVVELLYNVGADIDSQDNRKVSCLMAAFRKGHIKVVKWMVNHVNQFPSDQEMTRFISTVSDKDLLDKCQECTKIIRAAKDQQAAKANKNATILLEELFLEKTREESKRAAAARRRERKKKKKLEKKEEKRKLQEENQKNELMTVNGPCLAEADDERVEEQESKEDGIGVNSRGLEVGEEGDSGIDANSQGSCSSNDVKPGASKRKEKKKKKNLSALCSTSPNSSFPEDAKEKDYPSPNSGGSIHQDSLKEVKEEIEVFELKVKHYSQQQQKSNKNSGQSLPTSYSSSSLTSSQLSSSHVFESSRHPADREDFEATGSDYVPQMKNKKNSSYLSICEELVAGIPKSSCTTSPKQNNSKREEGWKEVVRKYLNSPFRSKKVSVPLNAISRVIGRGGSNINAIRTATGAHIEVEKQCKGQGERIITIKGSTEATKQAHSLIAALIKDPDVDILQLLPKSAKSAAAVWEKSVNSAKLKTSNVKGPVVTVGTSVMTQPPKLTVTSIPVGSLTTVTATKTIVPSRTSAPRLISGSRVITNVTQSGGGQTFAAKLTETSGASLPPTVIMGCPVKTSVNPPISSGNLNLIQTPTTSCGSVQLPSSSCLPSPHGPSLESIQNPNPQSVPAELGSPPSPLIPVTSATLEYSLFNDTFTKVAQQSMWGKDSENQKSMNFASVAATGAPVISTVMQPKFLDPSPLPVDASKAPGYRGSSVCSPVSKSSSGQQGNTPPTSTSCTSTSPPYYHQGAVNPAVSTGAEIATSGVSFQPRQSFSNEVEHSTVLFHPQKPAPTSRLNPRAPDFSTSMKPPIYNHPPPSYLQSQVNNNVVYNYNKAHVRPNGQNRWQFMGNHPYPSGETPIHLTMGLQPEDLLSTMENGVQTGVSPPSQPPPSEKLPPRPIGTERAWKNYGGVSQEVEMPPSWMVEHKMSWHGVDQRHPIFRQSNVPQPPPLPPQAVHSYQRIPLAGGDIAHLIESAYQGGLEAGTGAPSLILPQVLSGQIQGTHFTNSEIPEQGPWEQQSRIEQIQEKQHVRTFEFFK